MKPNALRSLKVRIHSALEMVRAHEHAENQIMMEAYWDDVGMRTLESAHGSESWPTSSPRHLLTAP